MPNSNFRLTRDDIIRAAFRRCGIRNPTATMINTDGAVALNVLVQELDGEGRFLWTRSTTESSITLSASTRTYTVGVGAGNIPDYMLALETFDLYVGTSYEPLEILKKKEAAKTFLRESTGKPVAVFLEVKADPTNNVLHVFQTPNGTYTGKFTYRRMLYDFDAVSDNPDFMPKWNRALILGVAVTLAGENGVPDLADIVAEYNIARARALASTEEPPAESRPVRITDF